MFIHTQPEEIVNKSGLKKTDITECQEIIRSAYSCDRMDQREGNLTVGYKQISQFKDMKFYSQTLQEILEVGKIQKKLYKDNQGKGFNINGSLAETIGFIVTNNDGKSADLAKSLKKELKLSDEVYNQVLVYHFARSNQWENINEFIAMKKIPCSPAAIGEICFGFDKREIAKMAFLKVSDADTKIEMLIEYEMWEDAVKQVYAHKK